MANTELSFLKSLGQNLGLDDPTIRKAKEFFRLCSIKSSIKINDIPKGVICLHLAANINGVAFNKELAVNKSTLSKQIYQNKYYFIEKILELNKPLSISEMCVKLSCNEVKELAEIIVKKYSDHNVIHDDLNHPQYNAAAIFTACKLKNIKTTASHFIQESHLKQTQWKQLESKFWTFSKNIGFEIEEKNASKRIRSQVPNNCDKYKQQIEQNGTSNKKNKQIVEEFEEYEVWKDRILKEAKEALRMEDQ